MGRRRRGGPTRSFTGLTRTGTNLKVMANAGGKNYPIVGDVTQGKLITVVTDGPDPVTEPLPPRHTAVLLAESDPYSGGVIPTTGATTHNLHYAIRGDTLLVWSETGSAISASFWVF